MITFLISVVLLFAGYFIYGKIVEKIFGIDANRPTPAVAQADGVDYVVLPTWKIFLIQFLNIAGLGPIFGAVMGAMFGPVAFLWIVFGGIFGGAVHDFLSGMVSIRNKGASLTEIIGDTLGRRTKKFAIIFSVFLMILVGAVFVSGPAAILAKITGEWLGVTLAAALIFAYYILATLLPVDKVIGKIYPVFGFALIFMAVGIFVALLFHGWEMPELTLDNLRNMHPKGSEYPIFPMLFISIACGAVSGFHATQSPMMARCMRTEKDGRRVFYGAMILESLVALTWAAAAMCFWGNVEGLNDFMAANKNEAAVAVSDISYTWLGKVGGILALLGVVFAPISSGDTAFRSARLMVADFFHWEQKSIKKRLMIAIPMFIGCFILLQLNFAIIWRYFAWFNQTLAVFTFWSLTVYLAAKHKNYYITLIPGLFMTAVCSAYFFVAPECLGLGHPLAYSLTGIVTALSLVLFVKKLSSIRKGILLQ